MRQVLSFPNPRRLVAFVRGQTIQTFLRKALLRSLKGLPPSRMLERPNYLPSQQTENELKKSQRFRPRWVAQESQPRVHRAKGRRLRQRKRLEGRAFRRRKVEDGDGPFVLPQTLVRNSWRMHVGRFHGCRELALLMCKGNGNHLADGEPPTKSFQIPRLSPKTGWRGRMEFREI